MERLKELALRAGRRIKEEPVLIAYAIALGANLGGYFGFEVPADLILKIDAVLIPALAVITRKKVSPISKLRKMSTEELIEHLDLDAHAELGNGGKHEA